MEISTQIYRNMDDETPIKKIDEKSSSATIRMIRFLMSKYEFKNNMVLNEVFAKEKDGKKYHPVNPHTLYIECRQEGYRTSVAEINTFLSSDFIPKTNPFVNYFKQVRETWSEVNHGDYIRKFTRYIQVQGQERFEVQFKKWLVRCVACCLRDDFFNKQALIFVQEQQNSGKTTLTRFLIPDQLKTYQAENISVDKDSLIALSQNFGIIQDELSTLSKTEINAQKTLMSKSQVKVRHPYDKKPKMEPRRASIWGSTNKAEFLTDVTGSVRWLCFTVREINWNYIKEIEIDRVWAQAYQLYLTNFHYEMTAKEIRENEIMNNQYKTISPEVELVQKFFSPGTKEDHDKFMTATDICHQLALNISGNLRISPVEIGKALKLLGHVQSQVRRNEGQNFPEKGYYIKQNQATTYYK
ncbi:VapE domain-containing protein [Cyclobacterium marinum]|uniref:Virulence-associated E family protein n=1 Tax=Cyclobacterium marinum (strain ATCC 25205 / DSM 745 / LMG 13164 / NCIMB 1802) TaxID=880070 RepID=G0J2Z8_CYCMS|nr:VapE domain-containing protein [Cyclobacterium marinum]AEL28294.1 virulence-associated E family protein [Cyclobacterium marinum DSM 745]MBR9777541.1 virulence protein E [Cytophagales bacterium]|tara:strand:+ start:52549 stop:53784 length:1236 start_codon:yes stop_codon:yes gene_type:complete